MPGSAIQPIWIVDAHRDGKRFVVRADELLTACKCDHYAYARASGVAVSFRAFATTRATDEELWRMNIRPSSGWLPRSTRKASMSKRTHALTKYPNENEGQMHGARQQGQFLAILRAL